APVSDHDAPGGVVERVARLPVHVLADTEFVQEEGQTPDPVARRPREQPHFELLARNAVDPVPFGHFTKRRHARRGGQGDAVPDTAPPVRCPGVLTAEGSGGGEEQSEAERDERDPRSVVHGLPPLGSAGAVGHGRPGRLEAERGQLQLRSCFASGRERMRLPVAAKIALHSAGITGGSGGSPRPVGGLSVLRKCTSISGGAWVSRSNGNSWKLLCTARPRSMVISCPSASASPSSTAPCTLFRALLGLMMWEPTSPAAQTLSTFSVPSRATVACTTSAKYPRWLKWNATPMPVPGGSSFCRVPQPDFSATSSSTPRMRAGSKRVSVIAASRMPSRNSTGSLPAACASSSTNDWLTNASALLPGARSAPVGMPNGMSDRKSSELE